MPEPDCFLRYHFSQSHRLEIYGPDFSAAKRNFTPGKSDVYIGLLAAAARSAFNMVLFTEPVSRLNTFVGGKWSQSSALLVRNITGKRYYFAIVVKLAA